MSDKPRGIFSRKAVIKMLGETYANGYEDGARGEQALIGALDSTAETVGSVGAQVLEHFESIRTVTAHNYREGK